MHMHFTLFVLLECQLFIAAGARGSIGWLSSHESFIPENDFHGNPRPGTQNCTLHFFEQTLDHFSWTEIGQRTFQQRYFVNADHWSGPGGPIFLYTGNEASVELYVNATGLMWENAAKFGAALVFAEHRYYGQSLPFNGTQEDNMSPEKIVFLTVEQALADYSTLINAIIADWGAKNSSVVAFGGSYGGSPIDLSTIMPQ